MLWLHILIPALIGGLASWAALTALELYRRPDYHCWPSVTRCRLCSRRIYAWQWYERREMGVNVSNPNNLPIRCTASCLVHCKCQGVPLGHLEVNIK